MMAKDKWREGGKKGQRGTGGGRWEYTRPLTQMPGYTGKMPVKLTREEEVALIRATKRHKAHMDVRETLTEQLGRPPTLSEWANGCGAQSTEDFEEDLRRLSEAQRVLVNCNTAFIASIVRRYFFLGDSVEATDLYQEGVFGYLKAAHLFDETRGCRLNTFAYRTVNQHVLTAAAKGSTLFTMPAHTRPAVIKMRRLRGQYRREGIVRYDDMIARLSTDLNMPVDKVIKLEKATRPLAHPESMTELVDNTRVRVVSEAEAPSGPIEYDAVIKLRGYFENAMSTLDPLERDLLRLMKGLDDGVRKSPRLVARMLEMKRKDLDALQGEAMAKMAMALNPVLDDVMRCANAVDTPPEVYSMPQGFREPAKVNSL